MLIHRIFVQSPLQITEILETALGLQDLHNPNVSILFPLFPLYSIIDGIRSSITDIP